MDTQVSCVLLCPGQGAQKIGMGSNWSSTNQAAAQTLAAADEALELATRDGTPTLLSQFCFDGPEDELNRTDISQPALYACAVASYQGLLESGLPSNIVALAGLSLGEYTALHMAGAFGFIEGLRLVATRGRLMQEAAESSSGGMVALTGADQEQAEQVCSEAAGDDVLVCANFNCPGQIVLSGHLAACERAGEIASGMGLRATQLKVAGAFHSPLMQPAADGMRQALDEMEFQPLGHDVWSNVTGRPHERENTELLKQRLVEQIVSPVKWSQCCSDIIDSVDADEEGHEVQFHELAPGSVLRGLMRKIDRKTKVTSHDENQTQHADNNA
ncbi:MAG: malonyl CoA-acyl carrier protein transacylase [Phycisphaerae bacterium]|nr:malonyl CoA-acyl carrier protein transacylase [Phycisphaerae bacterium]